MLDDGMQKLDLLDLGLTKLSVMCFVLAILGFSPKLARDVGSVHPLIWLLAALLVGARPTYRFFK
jgi:hypothetical protein